MFVLTINLVIIIMILRQLAIPIVSMILVAILMTSPLTPLLGKDYCTLMVLGSSEEENNSHDNLGSKVFEAKYFLLKNFFEIGPSILQEHHLNAQGYEFSVLEHTIEILDPPPRKLI